MRKNIRSRAVLGGVVAIVAATALAGCSSTAPSAPPTTSASGGTSSTSAPASTQLTQASVIAAAPVASSLPSSPTITAIKNQGSLKYGGNADSPLFSQLNPATGKYEGFEAGLAYMFAKYVLGKPDISFTAVDPANREALIENGTVQFVEATYAITPARAKLVNFAGPTYDSGDGILVLASNTSVKSVSDLNGKTVATTPGVGVHDIETAAPKAHVITFSTPAELVQAVLQGRATAMTLNMPSVLAAVAQNKGKVRIVSSTPFTHLAFGIGLPKSDPVLKTIVNKWLVTIEQDGEYAKLWKATVGDLAPVPTPPAIGSAAGS